MPKPRLLWVGDTPTVPTGFGRVTENVLERLRSTWAVGLLGINYQGDPHKFPYPIYPAHAGGDVWGVGRYDSMVEHTKPDVCLAINDPWVVARFASAQTGAPLIGYMPLDAPNQPVEAMTTLSGLSRAIFYTRFGLEEAQRCGFEGEAEVIPHGVNAERYRPIEQAEARRTMSLADKIPANSFFVGNINRNQPRKRLDLTLMYFARWCEQHEVPDNVYLVLHCARQDIGWDLTSLARYLHIERRLIYTNAAETSMTGIPEEGMPYVYSSLDVQVSTTLGEGWGLTTHEGMACGVPQLVPEWSALAEWPRGAVRYAPVSSFEANNIITTIGGIADPDAFVAELDLLYRDRDLREEYGRLAHERATEDRFTWDNVAQAFDRVLRDVVAETSAVAEPEAIAV